MRLHRTAIIALAVLAPLGFGVPLAASDLGPPAAPTLPGDAPATPPTATLDPCSQVNAAAPAAGGPCDTPQTPVAKPDSNLWTQVAGSVAGPKSPGYDPASSPTAAADDLFAVASRNSTFAFAAGAACIKPNDPVATCTRHPVMYRFADVDGHGSQWRPDASFPGDGSGFVGAIAWIPHTDKFLAVGGDGCYPRREVPCAAAAGPPPAAADAIAGNARAWLFANGSWRELRGSELPTRLGGMTALDFSPQPSLYGHAELGVAGGAGVGADGQPTGQLTTWQDGRFQPMIDRAAVRAAKGTLPSVGGQCVSANVASSCVGDFRFRVRDIRAQVSTSGHALSSGRFIAATAGCCYYEPTTGARDPSKEHAVQLSDDIGHWTVRNLVGQAGAASLDPRLISAYAVQLFKTVTPSYLLNADGPQVPGEPPSAIEDPLTTALAPQPPVGSVRLVSADGLSVPSADAFSNPHPFDWYVGVDPSTGHGLAYGTLLQAPGNGIDASKAGAGQTPTVDQNKARHSQQSYQLLDLGSYGLNAFREVGETSGVGWAVGDRGAIVHLGESAPGPGAEPPPPLVGSPTPGSFTSTAAYDAFRPLVAGFAGGSVPALESQPRRPLSQPGPVAGGSPNPAGTPAADVASVIMSRDGSEGWAVGGQSGLALFHYEGSHWSGCDPLGAPPLIPADPHCADLARLAGHDLRLLSAARVPDENASDAARSDSFEVVAVGDYRADATSSVRDPIVVRYRDGAWREEDPHATAVIVGDGSFSSSLTSVAFTAPNDGWLIGTTADVKQHPAPIYRFDGDRWVACFAKPTACDDSATGGRLPQIYNPAPVDQRVLQFTTAGRRVYLSGARVSDVSKTLQAAYPVIICHDPGRQWTAAGCGYDPGIDQATAGPAAAGVAGQPALEGVVESLTVERDSQGSYRGWAVGSYGGNGRVATGTSAAPVPQSPDARLLHLAAGSPSWVPWHTPDAAADYLATATQTDTFPVVALSPGPTAFGSAVMATMGAGTGGPLLGFGELHQRWKVVATPVSPSAAEPEVNAQVRALAADGSGGFWMAAGGFDSAAGPGTWFYRYTDRAPAPVFSDVSHPLSRPITALAGAANGTVWAGTDSDLVGRYDRLTGWDMLRIPGWSPGLVTANAPVNAIAVGPDGRGLAVGGGGRIADLGSTVKLDAATGAAVCSLPPVAPVCGTGRNLRATAIAPDGSALVGGDALTLLWRTAAGDFQPVAKPPASLAARITGIAMPYPDKAWLTANTGQIFAGKRTGDIWSWQLENTSDNGDLLTNDADGHAIGLRAIAVDSAGKGFAVGDKGLVLERDPRNTHPWRRLDTGFGDDLTSVTLPSGVGDGVLIGGANGLILTLTAGRFEVARQADHFTDSRTVVGMALMSGLRTGQTEAWAALSNPGSGSTLMHYSSDPGEQLLDPDNRAKALPDSPALRPGEVSVAALGQSDCHLASAACDPLSGLAIANDVGARRVADAVIAASHREGGPRFAVFSGDINDSTGQLARTKSQSDGQAAGRTTPASVRGAAASVSNWATTIADNLRAHDVPIFAAIGYQDVTSDYACVPDGGCYSQKQLAGQGACAASQCVTPAGNPSANLLWRQALADQPAPWGAAPSNETAGLSYEPVIDAAGSTSSPLAGARTHYALDVTADHRKLLRLVVLDNSQRSLGASDPAQHPIEPGGQQAWLQQVLCTTPGCGRASNEPAIVVANTPTYSYGPGVGTAVAADAVTFESTLIANRASAVVSGRIGWNARYWALAPGLHCPAPGGAYTDQVPDPTQPRSCAQAAPTLPSPDKARVPSAVTGGLANTLRGLGAPAPPDPTGTVQGVAGAGLLPFVVASGAGGKLAASTGEGEWHGYSIVRLDGAGEPAKTIVEQRPVFDWLSIFASERTLYPGQHVTLRGVGREPLSVNEPAQLDPINTPAITHRYDLVEADPERPYLPRKEPSGKYVQLDSRVGTVDGQSGRVTTGRGDQPRTYAVAILSVGSLAASYPLVFEPRRSYVAPRSSSITLPPVSVPPIHVASVLPGPALGTAPPSPPSPTVGGPILPTLPSVPSPPAGLPMVTASTPAIPPIPAPPASTSQPPLVLSTAAMRFSIVPGVVPPTPPPVNPAPPSGSAARKEAKQRQAATARSEQSADARGGEAHGRVDAVDGAHDHMTRHHSAMTRRAQVRPAPSFHVLAERAQASAWTRGVLYGGSLGVVAMMLALAFTVVRPTLRGRSRAAVAASGRGKGAAGGIGRG